MDVRRAAKYGSSVSSLHGIRTINCKGWDGDANQESSVLRCIDLQVNCPDRNQRSIPPRFQQRRGGGDLQHHEFPRRGDHASRGRRIGDCYVVPPEFMSRSGAVGPDAPKISLAQRSLRGERSSVEQQVGLRDSITLPRAATEDISRPRGFEKIFARIRDFAGHIRFRAR